MKVVLLTDDYYLKLGIEQFIATYMTLSTRCIHIPSDIVPGEQIGTLVDACSETAFVIAIEDEQMLLKISTCIPSKYSHIIFMFDSPDHKSWNSGRYGVFLSKKISLYKFFDFLKKCKNNKIPKTSDYWKKKSIILRKKDAELFNLLINGACMRDVAREIDVKNKTAYVIRKRILDQLDMGSSGFAFKMNILKKILQSRALIIKYHASAEAEKEYTVKNNFELLGGTQ